MTFYCVTGDRMLSICISNNKEVKTVHRFWKLKVLIPTANMIANAKGKMTLWRPQLPRNLL